MTEAAHMCATVCLLATGMPCCYSCCCCRVNAVARQRCCGLGSLLTLLLQQWLQLQPVSAHVPVCNAAIPVAAMLTCPSALCPQHACQPAPTP